MMRHNRWLQSKRKPSAIGGFTLLEVLIVIVVLGILSAVVIFALGGVVSKTASASCQADGATLANAIQIYKSQNENTPDATPVVSKLLSGTSTNGLHPYILSWPSNLPHYAFGLIAGVLYIEIAGTSTWNSSPTPGSSLSTGTVYTSSALCATAA